MIDSDAVLERNPELIAMPIDGETVVLDAERGKYTGLGGIGGRVWELLAKPITAAQIGATLVSEFEVDADVCRDDLLRFLDDLLAIDAIRRC